MAGLLLMAVVLAGVGLFIRDRHTYALAMIESELTRRRATDIQITADWFDFDRNTLSYDVTYRAPSGERRENRCKVGVGLWADNALYWSEPLG